MENQTSAGNPGENDFLNLLTVIIGENLSDENFGVSELAREVNMSRSNLLRKINKLTKLSASQFIRQVRLKKAMELLRQTSMNVSEVSYQVGFASPSYFIKCFREYYGYPPGEVGKRLNEPAIPAAASLRRKAGSMPAFIAIACCVLIGVALFFYLRSSAPAPEALEKSIAVLPFKNDSNDSTNIYLINGLMESTLNNLQKIRDVRVTSRTSSEKYRNTSKSISEMASELNVNYFVEGSGQKIGDKIVLNIQLIEASTDRHLWAKQYRREAKDIFELQEEVAKNIAEEIQVILTPEEEEQIGKRPTYNLVAYDYYLKGRELFFQSTGESLRAAIPFYQKAIEEDNEFALAYAEATMVYFYLDLYQTEKKYAVEIREYSEKAIRLDPTRGEALVAKAFSYVHQQSYEQAVPYLEKALEHNPNSGIVLHFLAEFYFLHEPNTAKYLEYSLLKERADVGADSLTRSYNYLQVANALIQTGFVDEAIMNANKSLAYSPANDMASFLKGFSRFGQNRNLQQARDFLAGELEKDSTHITFLQEMGNVCYLMRDYETAYRYYRKFVDRRESSRLEIYRHGDLKVAVVFAKKGLTEEVKKLRTIFRERQVGIQPS